MTSVVFGNGTYDFAVVATSSDGADFRSREGSASTRPQLLINSGGSTTATATSSATQTNTPTGTPTANATTTASPTDTPSPTNTPSPTSTSAGTPPSGNGVLSPNADARVSKSNKSTNYGTQTTLRVDGGSGSHVETFVRFAIPAESGTIQSAKLRLFVTSGTVDGPSVYAGDSSWTETGVTWNSRPARTSGMLADAGSSPSGTWMEVDVTAAVTAGATVTFVLAGESTDGVDFASREYGTIANRPQLVIASGGATTQSESSSQIGGAPASTEPGKAQATKTPTAEAPTVTPSPSETPTAEPTSTSTPTPEPTDTEVPTTAPTDTATPTDVPILAETPQTTPQQEQPDPPEAERATGA